MSNAQISASLGRNRLHAENPARRGAVLGQRRGTRPTKPMWPRALSMVFTGLVVACAVYLWPARLGGETRLVIVRGTSMEPVYHLNDIVVSRDADSYEVGDIVVFSVPEGVGEGMLMIHRLIGQRTDGSWITQGDNRDAPDPFELRDEDLHGKPAFVAPKAGRLIVWANNAYVLSTTIGLLVILVLWPKKPPPVVVPDREAHTAAQTRPLGPQPPEVAPMEHIRVSSAARGLIVAVPLAAESAAVERAAAAMEAETWLADELVRLDVSV